MYKSATRALLRHSIKRLNQGDASLLLRMADQDAVIVFPGHNSWATMFRPVHKDRTAHATHRGIDECRAFADRFTDEGVQFEIEDILVNGPPWNTRIALRVQSHLPGSDGVDVYNNRAIALLEIRWGKLVAWEDYEDTERVAAWDQARPAAAAPTPSWCPATASTVRASATRDSPAPR